MTAFWNGPIVCPFPSDDIRRNKQTAPVRGPFFKTIRFPVRSPHKDILHTADSAEVLKNGLSPLSPCPKGQWRISAVSPVALVN
jgi:hypothetical protein